MKTHLRDINIHTKRVKDGFSKNTHSINMSLLLLLFPLLRTRFLLQLPFVLLGRKTGEGISPPTYGQVRHGEPSHLSGVLGLIHIPEYRLGDQMLQMLFHPFHRPLLPSVTTVVVVSSACGHKMVYSVVCIGTILNKVKPGAEHVVLCRPHQLKDPHPAQAPAPPRLV